MCIWVKLKMSNHLESGELPILSKISCLKGCRTVLEAPDSCVLGKVLETYALPLLYGVIEGL